MTARQWRESDSVQTGGMHWSSGPAFLPSPEEPSHFSQTLPPLASDRRQFQSTAISFHSTASRFMRGPERSAEDHAAGSQSSMFGKDLLHRTLMSSKKASAATLSTDIPGTDSAMTLHSSQKSLPSAPSLQPQAAAAAAALPLLPPTFGAFRGNPRPPMTGATSATLPQDQRRPPRAPLTAR